MENIVALPLNTTLSGALQATAGAISARKFNLSAVTDPGVGNDSSQSYAVGSLWVNAGKRVYIAVDVTVGAAIWRFFGGQSDTSYATTSGTDTYIATMSPAPTSYSTGMLVQLKFGNANTGAATINLNTLGAKTIQKNGSALVAADLPANSTIALVYDGTNFQMVGSASSGGGSGLNIVTIQAFS